MMRDGARIRTQAESDSEREERLIMSMKRDGARLRRETESTMSCFFCLVLCNHSNQLNLFIQD